MSTWWRLQARLSGSGCYLLRRHRVFASLCLLLNLTNIPPGMKGRCTCFHFIGQDVKGQKNFAVSWEPAETSCVHFSMLLHFKEYVFYNIHFYTIHIMNMSVFLVRQSQIGCDLYYSSKKTEQHWMDICKRIVWILIGLWMTFPTTEVALHRKDLLTQGL